MNLLKSLQQNYKSHHLIALLAIILLVIGVNVYSGRKGLTSEGNATRISTSSPPAPRTASSSSVQAANPLGENEVFARAQGGSSSGIGLPPSCSRQPVTDPADLLPQDANSKWAQLNPGTAGDVNNVNFLKAGHFTGIDTVGASLRNANLQVRSEPPNPQTRVSPWLNSTIEPDLMRVPLEVGCGPQ